MEQKIKIEYRYYEIPEKELVLALLGEEWVRSYGLDYLHFHNYMEVGICCHGKGEVLIEEQRYPFQDTKLATIFSSGNMEQLPDITLAQDYNYQKYLRTYDGLFEDLTDSGIDFSQFSEGKLGVSMLDGKYYGVPFDNGAEIAAYRVDLLEEAGYTVEDLTDIDWDRFIEIGKDVLDKTGYTMFSSQAGSVDLIVQILRSAGGSIWKEDGSPYYVGDEKLEATIQVYKKLYDSGVMAMGNSWDEYIGTFTSGKTLGVINGCWIMASIETMEDTAGKWAITNMPSLPGTEGATNYSNQGGSTWGITSTCRNKDLARIL